MILSRSLRRLVAGAIAALFLACQGMSIVYARSVDAPGSGVGAAAGSCHDTGQQAGNAAGNSACPSNCQSLNNSSSPSSANVLAVTDLPAITTRIEPVASVAKSALPDEPLLLVEPPPLTILHCCLRN